MTFPEQGGGNSVPAASKRHLRCGALYVAVPPPGLRHFQCHTCYRYQSSAYGQTDDCDGGSSWPSFVAATL